MQKVAFVRRAAQVLLALSLASCGAAPAADGSAPKAPSGPKAPDFSLPALDGSTVRLTDHFGKNVVLIDFWSTTCDPCLVEMPHLVDIYKEYKDKGFVVLAVSLDGPESRAQVGSVAHDKGMDFPVLLDEETSVVARYNPKRELPFSVLIARDGSIIQKRSGYQPGEEAKLREEVGKAVAQ